MGGTSCVAVDRALVWPGGEVGGEAGVVGGDGVGAATSRAGGPALIVGVGAAIAAGCASGIVPDDGIDGLVKTLNGKSGQVRAPVGHSTAAMSAAGSVM